MSSQNPLQLVTTDIYGLREAFESVLVDKSIAFEREAQFALQLLQANDYTLKVATQNRQSLVNAITNVAAIGISLNPAKKQAYLVPRKVNGATAVCLDISYMGLMDLAVLTGSIRWAQAAVVREKDTFSLRGYDAAPDHKFDPFAKDRGPLVGVYVVAKTKDGDFLTHTMSIADVYAIRDRSEAWKAYVDKKIKTCPWVTDEDEMVKKTCVKQGSKYWPDKSPRLEAAIHHLNTEGGETIELGGQATNPYQALRDECIAAINATKTADELRAVTKVQVRKLNEARDREGYAQLVAAVQQHGAKFTATDVDHREAA